MNQMNYCVLDMLQATAERQAAYVPTQKNEQGTERSSFQKMLDAKVETGPVKEQSAAVQSTEKAEMTPGNAIGSGEEDTDLELQNQMIWAALMALRHPVVAIELAQQAPQAELHNVLSEDQPILNPVAYSSPMPETSPETAEDSSIPLLDQAPLPDKANASLQVSAMKPDEKNSSVVHQTFRDVPLPDAVQSSKENTQQMEFGLELPVFRDIHGLPVKVGEAPDVEQAGKQRPVEAQLFERLSTAVDRGETKVDIQLEPENLGHVRVEMTWSKDGALHVSMYAESSQTQKLLERDLAGLEFLLSRNSQQEVTVEVNRQQESAREAFYDGHQNGGGQQEDQPDHPNKQKRDGQDFLQQLRLGLIPLEEAVS